MAEIPRPWAKPAAKAPPAPRAAGPAFSPRRSRSFDPDETARRIVWLQRKGKEDEAGYLIGDWCNHLLTLPPERAQALSLAFCRAFAYYDPSWLERFNERVGGSAA